MKMPKMSDLAFDRKGTRSLRSRMVRAKKIKITINVEERSLQMLRKISGETGAPYQALLNQFLKEGLLKKGQASSRLDRIESELEKIKRQLAA